MVSHESSRKDIESIEGVQVYRQPTFGRFQSLPLTYWPRRVVQEINPDLIHYHLPNPLALFRLAVLPLPQVATMHAFVDKMFWGELHKLWHRRALSGMSRLYFSSHAFRDLFLKQYPKSPPQTQVIPFGVSQPSSIILPPSEVQILFIGRLVGYKGLRVLLHAMESVDGNLTVLGEGPQRSELNALTTKLGLTSKVHFLGEVSEELKQGFLSRCKLLVLPSTDRRETFGLVQLEAMAAGKPVVVTRLGTGVEQVAGAGGLVVQPGNSQVLATVLNELLGDSDRCEHMGNEGKERFLESFTVDQMIESYLTSYNRLLRSQREELKTIQVFQ
jgi:rhamnosyl/mannosyltransferase